MTKKKTLYQYQVNIEYRDTVEIIRVDAYDDSDAELKGLYYASDKLGWPALRVSINTVKIE